MGEACGQGSLGLLRESALRGPALNCVAYTAAIGACGQCSAWIRALDLLEKACLNSPSDTALPLDAAVCALNRASYWQDAVGLLVDRWHGMIYGGTRWLWAFDLLASLWPCSVEPDLPCVVPAGNPGSSHWQLASDCLQSLLQLSSEAVSVVYASTLRGCERGRKWQLVLTLVQQMALHCFRPDATSLAATAGSCSRAGSWRWALAIPYEAQANNIAPDLRLGAAALVAAASPSQVQSTSSSGSDKISSMNSGSWRSALATCSLGWVRCSGVPATPA